MSEKKVSDLQLLSKESVKQGDQAFEQTRDWILKQARLDGNQVAFVIPGVFIQTPDWEETPVSSFEPIFEELQIGWSRPIELGKCSHLEELVI